MGFLKEQMSKAVDHQLASRELKAERNTEFGNQLRASYLERLEVCISDANDRAREILSTEIPLTPAEYILFVKYCEKKANMPLNDAFSVDLNREAGVSRSDFNLKQPDEIIRKAWEEKLQEALDAGEVYLSQDPTVSAFFAERKEQAKKEKIRLAIILGSIILVIVIWNVISNL